MQRFFQADGAEQKSLHLRGGRQLRDHESATESVPVLPFSKVPRPGNGPGRRQRGQNAWRKEFRRCLQSLQGEIPQTQEEQQ